MVSFILNVSVAVADNSQISETKYNIMNNNYLQELSYDFTRNIVTSHVGNELTVKEHNGWKYVNYKGAKIGISKMSIFQEETEEFNYIFNYGFRK